MLCQQQQERMTKELKYTVHDIFRVLLFHHCQRIITPATAHVGAMDVRIHRVPIKRRHCDGSSNARVGDDDRIDWRHSFCQHQRRICRQCSLPDRLRHTWKIEHRFNKKHPIILFLNTQKKPWQTLFSTRLARLVLGLLLAQQ